LKYVIIGIPHCGTCSLEKFLIDQGHDVIRAESLVHDLRLYQRWYKAKGRPVMIISNKWTDEQLKPIYETWKNEDVWYLHLEEIMTQEGFPWENKGDSLTHNGIRPVYKKG
jgi:hypothetical protein